MRLRGCPPFRSPKVSISAIAAPSRAAAVKGAAGKFESGYVFFNNHFAGFSPESSNEFRRLLGLMELDWKAEGTGTGQQTLFGS